MLQHIVYIFTSNNSYEKPLDSFIQCIIMLNIKQKCPITINNEYMPTGNQKEIRLERAYLLWSIKVWLNFFGSNWVSFSIFKFPKSWKIASLLVLQAY